MAKKKASPAETTTATSPAADDIGKRDVASDPGGYVVVARRYRPKTFEELVGQGHVGRALSNAIATARVGHAYLFTGARGVGKTSTARIFAKALNNPDGPSSEFDDSTDMAQAIDSGEDVDVIEIDGASNRGIDEIRSLRANAGVRPSRGRYKIYIIDEVHMLTQAAFNALLKTLEEPPEHVKFIFCTTDPEKIPITVLSRCQRFDFAPVEVNAIVGRLQEIIDNEGATADAAALELIARRASGSMRDSQSLLEQVLSFAGKTLDADTVHQILGTADDTRLAELTRVMADGDASRALQLIDAAIDGGIDAGRLAEQLLEFLRDVLAAAAGCDASLMQYSSASMFETLQQLGQDWGLQTVLAVVGILDETISRIRLSIHGRVLLEAAVIQVCRLPDLQAIADIAAAGPGTVPAGTRPAAEKKKRLADSDIGRSRTAGPPGESPTDTAASATAGPATAVPEKSDPAPSNSASTTAPSSAATSSPSSDSSAAASGDIWKRVLASLPPTTAPLVAAVSEVRRDDDGVWLIKLPGGHEMSAKRLSGGAHHTAMTESLAAAGGSGRFKVVVAKAPPAAEPSTKSNAPDAPKLSRAQRIREAEQHPLVRDIIATFQAVVTKVEVHD